MKFDNLSSSDVFTFKLHHRYFNRRPLFAVIEKNIGAKEIEEIETFFECMQSQFEIICGEENISHGEMNFTYEEMLYLLCTFFGAKKLDVTIEEEESYDRQYDALIREIDYTYPHGPGSSLDYHLENLNEYPFYYYPLDMYSLLGRKHSEFTTFQDRCKDDKTIQKFFEDAINNPERAGIDHSIIDLNRMAI